MKTPVLYLLLLFFAIGAKAQGPSKSEVANVIERVNKVTSDLAIEKLYLQTDKPSYAVNDTLWFKAYLLDAAYLNASAKSGLLYLEIVKDDNMLIKRMMVPVYTGMAFGQIDLIEKEFKQGNYTLRAYTNWMRNFRENYIFKKDFIIYGLDSTSLNTLNNTKNGVVGKTQRVNPKSVVRPAMIDLQFMPEGGDLVASLPSKVAFKALNENGYGADVSGTIVNSKGKEITKFSSLHRGIGSFNLTPDPAETYTAKISLPDGTIKNYPLPAVKSSGFVLHINNEGNKDSCEVWLYVTPDLIGAGQTYLFAQARGIICFGAVVKMKGNFIRYMIAKNLFPTGVANFTLSDNNNKILSERLIYVDNKDELKINLTTDKPSYGRRDSVAVQIHVTDNKGAPVQGSFSLAVTDDGQVKVDSVPHHSISNWLLLVNELKGNVEDPGYYRDPSHWKELDNLLLAQGWSGYEWNEMDNLAQHISYPAEEEFAIKGRVTNAFNKPVAGSRVVLLSNKPMLVIDTLTNDKGMFVFKGIVPSDTAVYFLQSRNKRNKEFNVGIELEEFRAPVFAVNKQPGIPWYVNADTAIIAKQAEIRKEFEHVTGVKTLQEVIVNAKMRIQDSKNLYGPGEADLIIGEEELKKAGNTTLGDLVAKRVPGFMVRTTKSGERYFAINTMMLHLIMDGMEVEFSKPEGLSLYDYMKQYFDYYDASDIKGIEVMKSARYQGRYTFKYVDPMANPFDHAFLEITTRSGHGPFVKKTTGTFLYRPLPFNVPRRFYVPKYAPASVPDMSDVRSTVFWHPNIITDKDGRATVSFYTADVPGSYSLVIEGSDLNGNIGDKKESISVSK